MKNIISIILTLAIGAKLFAQQDTYEEKLDVLYSKAYQHLYKNNDSTSYYFDQIFKIAFEKEDWSNVFESVISENRNAGYYYDLKTLKKNLLFLDSLSIAKKSYLDSISDGNLYVNSILYDKGNYFFKVNNFRDARKAFQTIISDIEKVQDELVDPDQIYLLSTAYSFMANMYQQEGKYKLAKQFYDKDIRYLEAKAPNDLEEINKRYSLLASLYHNENDFDNSNRLYRKVIAQITADKIGDNTYISACNNITQNYILQQQQDSAEYYLRIVSKYIVEGSPFEAAFYTIQSEKFQLENKYPKARESLKKALSIEKQHNGENKKIAEIHKKTGLLHAKFGKTEKALIEFEKGIEILSGSSSTIDRFTLLDLHIKNANTLNKQTAYSKTLQSTQQGIKIIDSLKPSFTNTYDKLNLIENSFPLFESAMEATFQIYNSTLADSLVDLAFDYAEKSKSVLLMEALMASKATKFANIPANLLEREKQLKAEINNSEKQLNTSPDNPDIEDALFELKNEYRNLVKKLETDYPKYYNLKYNAEVVSISEAQQLLSDDEIMVSYFYGNDAIYSITITRDTKDMRMILVDDTLKAKIVEINGMLGDPKSNVSDLAKKTHSLYQRILQPSLSSEKYNRLIVISDGLLNYIPFGALNTQANELSYLIEKYAISYVNSATLYQQLSARSLKEGDLLAFAPSFNGEQVTIDPSRDNLLDLPHNKKEVEQILKSFKGKSFVGPNATLQNFNSELSNYGMLHLATHAIFNDASPEYSFLAFSSVPKEENLLYVSDLYNLQIDANMVTLSACESGIGELKKGEGFISLARGFFYSGASSITSTLWKVNDASSTALMDSFYKNLSKGDTKDIALQKAKLTFIENNAQNALSHPYYWSGFVVSGNTEPLVDTTNWMWIVLGSLLIFALVYWLYHKKTA